MQIGSNFNLPPKNINPNTYAQRYATENNISIDKAREELQSKYGTPQANDESIFTSNNIKSSTSVDNSINIDDLEELSGESDSDFSFSSLFKAIFGLFRGIGMTSMGTESDKDPDKYAQEYATKHNISVEEAKEELEKQYGKPEKRAGI